MVFSRFDSAVVASALGQNLVAAAVAAVGEIAVRVERGGDGRRRSSSSTCSSSSSSRQPQWL